MFTKILYILTVVLLILSLSKDKKKTKMALKKATKAFENILPQFLAILIIIGLMLSVLSPKVISSLMGQQSGWIGVVASGVIGSITLMIAFVTFPVAQILLKNGSKFSNVLIFIGAWSTTKIPLLLFEGSALGWKFTGLRFVINIFGIALIAYATEKLLSNKEKEKIYANAS